MAAPMSPRHKGYMILPLDRNGPVRLIKRLIRRKVQVKGRPYNETQKRVFLEPEFLKRRNLAVIQALVGRGDTEPPMTRRAAALRCWQDPAFRKKQRKAHRKHWQQASTEKRRQMSNINKFNAKGGWKGVKRRHGKS